MAVAIAGLLVVLTSGGNDYTVLAKFRQAGGLREGFKVRIDGVPVGAVGKLSLNQDDVAVAELDLDQGAVPIGQGASAQIRAADLLGEKYVDLNRGKLDDPLPSGTVIPPTRTGVSVELDDVINALDLPTRTALASFLSEQGNAFVGRGRDLARLLAALPPGLDRTAALVNQFAADDKALGRLVEESNRIVTAIAPQRASLGKLVGATGTTLATLGSRHRDLAGTVREAPPTLSSLRTTLAALQGAAAPLGPAARGLQATAPSLTRTLQALPAFSDAARPTLRTARRSVPSLTRLGTEGTPLLDRIGPLTSELDSFAANSEPFTETLEKGFPDTLGTLEGWARTTQPRDAAGHVFRVGLTVGGDIFQSVLNAPEQKVPKPPTHAGALSDAGNGQPTIPLPGTPKGAPTPGRPPMPTIPLPKLPSLLPGLQGGDSSSPGGSDLSSLLDFLLAP